MVNRNKRDAERWHDRLNAVIERRGISDAALGRACGISRQTIGEWRKGYIDNPKLAGFFCACVELNVRPRWLALGEEPIEPLPDDYPRISFEFTDLLRRVAEQLAKRTIENQERVLEIVLQLPEAPPTRPSERRAAAK